jgi:hypothetical protein
MTNIVNQPGEFLRGQIDCQNGVDHKPGQSPDYDRGYATQYEWEQVQTELSRGH